jgi:hypothetical protein
MGLITLFLFFAVLIFSGRIIRLGHKKINIKFNAQYMKYGFLSRYYLSGNLTPYNFEEWCKYILKNMHYNNLENISENIEGGVNIISTNNNIPTYISTRLYGLQSGEKNNISDNYKTIGRPEVQKFVGALVHDGVKNGIIITTGGFSKEANEYVKSLGGDYLIVLIDGISLTKELRKIRRREIATRIAAGVMS